MDQWDSFYFASKLGFAPQTQQRAYLLQCVDEELADALNTALGKNAALYGEDSYLEFIRQEKLRTFPMFSRRQAFFAMTHKRGQPFSQFVKEMKAQGLRADVKNMTVDEMYVCKVICACTDDVLKQQLIAVQNPTLPQLEQIINTYCSGLSLIHI